MGERGVSARSFAGRYEVKFDTKQHRAAVPSELRDLLGEKFIVSKPKVVEKCLFAYTMEYWDELQEEANRKSSTAKAREHQRVLGANSRIVTTDKQGRATLPADLCGKAFLLEENISNILFIGAGRRIEIWNPELFEEEMARIENEEDDEEYLDLHF